jgi:hypothetical protein
MSYASASRALGDVTPVGVGKRAFSDPVLAKASLDASSIMLAMAKVPSERRLQVMESSLDELEVPSAPVLMEMKKGLVSGANPDQVAFDALRLAIANTRLDRSLENIRHNIATRSGWDSLVDVGLGSGADDRATGCMIASGANMVGGVAQVVPVYGQIVGLVTSIGSTVAGQVLDCGKEARDAATAAARAQAQLAAAQQVAASQQAAAEAASRKHRFQTVAVGGAILLTVLGAAWMVLD